MMNIEKYISDNIDDILDNPDEFTIGNKLNIKNKKVRFLESKNNYKNIDDVEEKEYLDYNQEYYNSEDVEDSDNVEDSDDIEDSDYEYNKISSLIEESEDMNTDEVIDELYQDMYNSSVNKKDIKKLFDTSSEIDSNNKIINKTNCEDLNNNELEKDDGYYFFNLINIFIKFYNSKYDKKEHFFSNIKNLDTDTSGQMEMFFDSVMEFKMMKKKMKLDNDIAMKQIYKESEPEKISSMFDTNTDSQLYMFQMGDLKLFSPSLMVFLNYIFINGITNNDWNIYNLKNN